MAFELWFALSLCLVLGTSEAGKQMPKLSDKKLCADSECSCKYQLFILLLKKSSDSYHIIAHDMCPCTDPILIARALQDYYPGDCRFIPIRQGQLVYVYAMLKDRGNLFWAGSVSKSDIFMWL